MVYADKTEWRRWSLIEEDNVSSHTVSRVETTLATQQVGRNAR